MESKSLELSKLKQLRTLLYLVLFGLLAVVTAVFVMQQKNATQKEPVFICGNQSAQFANPLFQKGKDLFTANCAACHNKNMKEDLTGPALSGVTARWSAYPKQDLYNFIRQSQQQIQQKHPRAKALWAKWQPTIMANFYNLTDSELDALLFYIENQ